ncbi:MAG: YggS family pyridoxal phosphate-dependent enzyme [Candidatus Omnitrophica bacterium]|nr:YggS family pyridoxal phosphate-dependent enzyme [Candidatus Omnitrophota bacterium]
MIKDNLFKIQQAIGETCRKIGRDPGEIVVVGASKYTDAVGIRDAIAAGLTDIGENRVQDSKEKFAALGGDVARVKKHMIGHLQTNKAKIAVELFDMIQSVDSMKLAEEIDKHAARLGKVMGILVQVNESAEEQKSGVDPAAASDLIGQISGLKNIRVQGLMTMAALTDNVNAVRQSFRQLRELRDRISAQFRDRPSVTMKYLSMGMSADHLIAIEEGANMVRVGRALFHEN